jgi:hypothetical protein
VATLVSLDRRVALTLSPERVVEQEVPLWIRTKTSVSLDGATEISDVVNCTKSDLLDLAHGLREASSRDDACFDFSNTDENLHVALSAAPPPRSSWVGIWLGEPHGLSKGLRLVADRAAIDAFGARLSDEVLDVVATDRGVRADH